MFGWHDKLSLGVFWGLAVLAILALSITGVWGVRGFYWPRQSEAVARVDAAMPGRPISAMADTQAIGRGDLAAEAVWIAHIAQMQVASRGASRIAPDLHISNRDTYGLRFISLLFLVTAFMFGSLLQVVSVGNVALDGNALVTSPVWEGWAEPPGYTGKPAIYLSDVPGSQLTLPAGSKITFRLYGPNGALKVVETISGRTDNSGAVSQPQQTFIAMRSGQVTIDGENGAAWDIRIIEDKPPIVDLIGPVEANAMGEMSQPFQALDDYGIESGTAVIALNLPAVNRKFGLAVAPDQANSLVLDLPMPFNGDRADFEAFLVENLSKHPLANLPVTLSMSVRDKSDQLGHSISEKMILPGRRFFQPFAKAVIEQRRDLMWARARAPQIALIIRALSHRPEGFFSNETVYMRTRTIIRRLEDLANNGQSDHEVAEIVQAMWDLAIQLEDGTLADARERLARAQERLAEAMRDGVSDAEIVELMQELRDATRDYVQMLADQLEPNDGTDQANGRKEEQKLGRDEIQALMNRIQELMEEGRMAEAAEMMAQLNQMMENLRITRGEGGDVGPQTPGQQSMQDLNETLQDQEDLSDETFRELQDRANEQDLEVQGGDLGQQLTENGAQSDQDDQQTKNGTTGENQQELLANRQQTLRDELKRQRDNVPNLDGDATDIARQTLDHADSAMDGAEEALRNGKMAQAIDLQAEAMDALRNGMRSLNQALVQNEASNLGQGTEHGEAHGSTDPARLDPLGRVLDNTGQFGTDEGLLQGEDVYRRAEEILDEIRRRSAEQNRPEFERDYLRRLLDQF